MSWEFTLTPEIEFELKSSFGEVISCHYCEGGTIPKESTLQMIVDSLNLVDTLVEKDRQKTKEINLLVEENRRLSGLK